MQIYCETYGCTMNKGDSELMLGKLEKANHKIVENIEDADIAIVNTCAVKRTTLNRVIYRLKELHENKNIKIIVAGCLPLIDLEKIENIGEFSAIISCLNTDQIDSVVEQIDNGLSDIRKIEGKSKKNTGHRYKLSEISAPVPIAEGCASNCSYCSVKYARGNIHSFSPEEIVNQVKRELDSGRKEIYITTQDTGAYGIDLEHTNLPKLIKKITSIPQEFKIRIGMMNPTHVKRILTELLEAYESEKVYKFLHLPIQSGNNEILKAMIRGYSVEDFREIVSSFRYKFSNLYLATDIIVGFPGEDESAFNDSCELMRELRPDKINLTRFTPMPKTDAKKMKQIRSEEKKRRSKKLSSLHKRISFEKNKEYVNNIEKGLVIKKGKKGGYEARIQNYKPVIIKNGTPGEFVKIKITEAKSTYLLGEKIK